MKHLREILMICLAVIMITACKKDDIEPLGFYEVDYYTSPDKDQTFLYYYDDGQLVAGSLDEYMLGVSSEAGTFEDEQLLLLKFKDEVSNFPDTLIPYTYFMGLNYQGEVNKDLTFSMNLDYPFNNLAHADYLENQFFIENISDMKLMKLVYEGLADIYYDPDYTLEEVPYIVDEEVNDVTFQTDDLNALYVLCWAEEQWSDSLSFTINGADGNAQDVLHQGYRYTPIDAEGATYRNGNLVLNYSPKSFVSEMSADDQGWKIQELRIKIANPAVGVVNPDDLQLSCLLSIYDGTYTNYTHLEVIPNTNFEIVSLPGINGYGEINISGLMRLQMSQSSLATNLTIKFKRQR